VNTLTNIIMILGDLLPDPEPVAPPGAEGIATIIGWAKWVALIVAVLALIAAGALIGVQRRRGEGDESLGWIVKILVGVVVVGAAASLVAFLAGY